MNREEWLNAVAAGMAPMFAALGKPLPTFRVSVGFPFASRGSKAIGQCWSHAASADGTYELFVSPVLADPVRVAGVLAHELVHAAVGTEAKHGPQFRKVAVAIGLEGKMTATTEGEAFKQAVAPILASVGPLPHARLDASLSGRKKQTTRLIKCQCPECGYIARTTQQWLTEAGAPLCPTDGVQLEV